MQRTTMVVEVEKALRTMLAGTTHPARRTDASQTEISERIARERARGHPQKQAAAIAYAELGEPGGRKDATPLAIMESIAALREGAERLDARIDAAIKRLDYITESGGKFTVHAESGKPMGTYGSKAEAEKRLREIEYFKHKG